MSNAELLTVKYKKNNSSGTAVCDCDEDEGGVHRRRMLDLDIPGKVEEGKPRGERCL